MAESTDIINTALKVRLRYDLLPPGVRVVSVSIDWDGEPLILCDEGKPPQPARDAGMQKTVEWLNAPPTAFRLFHVNRGELTEVRWRNQTGTPFLGMVQRFGSLWLTSFGVVLDDSGNTKQTIDLDSGIESLQTTPDGHIWVSYFDEGVYSNLKVAPSGLACFDPKGEVVFRFDTFADEHKLPQIDDCYTLNVDGERVWLCYYSDFPLVCIKNFKLERVWEEFGATKALAVRAESFLRFPAYSAPYLTTRTFQSNQESIVHLQGVGGKSLSEPVGELDEDRKPYVVPFDCIGRGSRMYVIGPDAVYEVPDSL